MKKLEQLLNNLENIIPECNSKNTNVSHATVGWQIEHSLKTIDIIVLACKNSNPTEYKWKFNFKRLLILSLLKKIPKGKAKAPKIVQPEGEISQISLQNSLAQVRLNLKDWNSLNSNAFFTHPFFGNLDKKKTIEFLVLHTQHHFQISTEILKWNS